MTVVDEREPVTNGISDQRVRPAQAALLAAVIILGLLLRFWRLGYWNFQATEMFTLRDSLTLRASNPRPLGYLLTHYLVGTFLPLDEFGLRLLPAVFGVVAIPAIYLVCRRLAGTRAALCATLLVAVSPLLVMYSQLARYWSLVFLLSSVYPYALYLGFRNQSRPMLAVGVVGGLLAALAHPVSVLLVGGLGLFLVTGLTGENFARVRSSKQGRWLLGLAAVLAAVILVRFIPVLHSWIAGHHGAKGRGQFLRPFQPAQGVVQLIDLANFVESLTVPLVLGALAGIWLLWQGRNRALARLLACLAGFHIGAITLLSLVTPVSQYYLLPAVPVFYIGAGAFLDQLFDLGSAWRPRWLLAAVVLAITIAAGAPTLISDAIDGRRYDFRSSARWIAARLAPDDVVFSDQPMVTGYYLPQHPVRHLNKDLDSLKVALDGLREAGRGGAMWIVAPAASHAYRPNMKEGGMIDWIYGHCRLRQSFGTGRIDFRQDYLHIFSCPTARAGAPEPEP
jgi:dolichyl-phosphate-mannose-protein mannosyltransferase